MRWTWWDWSLSLGTLLPSVLWHCWLGHLTRKNRPEMTYNVFSGTLNPTHLTVKGKQVVKVIWHKTASPPQTDCSIVFARWHHCAFPCRHIGATWRIRLNVCFLWPTRVHNPNGKWIRSAVLAQLTTESPYTYNGHLFPPICPFRWGIWTPI